MQKYDWGLWIAIAIFMGFLALASVMGSCATQKAAFQPCLDSPRPPRAQIVELVDPSPFNYTDANGDAKQGVMLAVEPTSTIKFFHYVLELEQAVDKASTCRR